MRRPKDGIINSKLTPYEMLQDALLQQAVADIKTTTWYKTTSDGMKCSYKEGAEAAQYIVLVLKNTVTLKRELATFSEKLHHTTINMKL